MKPPRVDLYSDTQTRPSEGMRQAIAGAEVGDEQRGEDPTVNRLQEMVAELLGKEAALFLPSGTMCNQIALRVWAQPGAEVILDQTAHPVHFEGGGPAALSGLMTRPIAGERGIFTAAQVAAAIRPDGLRHMPRSVILSIEQTSNLGGGAVWPLTSVEEVAGVAHQRGLKVHMDGARLPNAVVASDTPAAAFSAPCDSVWIDLSKGLGCPVGAVLAGSAAFIEEAFRCKHQFGGAMRQAGIIAAAGVYALEHNMGRLAEDHANAASLAEGLSAMEAVSLDLESVETNMVYFDVNHEAVSARQLCRVLESDHGVRMGAMNETRIRAVTHLDVSADGIASALTAVRTVLQS